MAKRLITPASPAPGILQEEEIDSMKKKRNSMKNKRNSGIRVIRVPVSNPALLQKEWHALSEEEVESLFESEETLEAIDKVWFEEEIKPIFEDKKLLDAYSNLPDPKELLMKWLKKSESEVSDDKFFELIKRDPIFLAFPFAQEKILRWQREMYDRNDVKAYAKTCLKKIGTTLAFWERRGVPKVFVATTRINVDQILKSKKILNCRNEGHKRLMLKELFGKEIIDGIDTHSATYGGLANEITAKMFNLSPGTVASYYKNCTRKKSSLIKERPVKNSR